MPSKLSSIAPPPVLIKLTSSCKLNFLIAATESPPPINEKAPLLVALATDFAIDKVPFSKAGISKTPIGPFHNMVLLSVTMFSKLDIVKGPISSPCQPLGMLYIFMTFFKPSLENSFDATTSCGKKTLTFFCSAKEMISLQSSSLSFSKIDSPILPPLFFIKV